MLLAISYYFILLISLIISAPPKIESHSVVQAVLELLSPGWLEPGAISCLSLPGAGITGVSHHAQLFILLLCFFKIICVVIVLL